MSHFVVGVILENGTKEKDIYNKITEMMEPYQENNMGDCPKQYLEFLPVDEEDMEYYKNDYEKPKNKYKYDSFDKYMEECTSYEYNAAVKSYGYYENPNAKWDWYEIGGRWNNMLKLTDGSHADYSYINAIDFAGMKEETMEARANTWDNEKEDFVRMINGIEKNDTREEYINRDSDFSTYAVITKDGKWHEKGKMGWWGISDETPENKNNWNRNYYDIFIKDLNPEDIFVVVDCHI